MNGSRAILIYNMTTLQAIVSIIVALIAGTMGGGLVFAKFWIERKDKKEENIIQKQIDDSIKTAKQEISEEIKEAVQQGIIDCGVIGDKAIHQTQEEFLQKLEIGLRARSEEGAERFKINSDQIKNNTEAIKEMIIIQKKSDEKFDKLAESISSLTTVSKACAEGVRSTLYDKICLVANRAIPRKSITTDEKANIIQLFKSYTELQGNGRAHVLYEECMKLPLIDTENLV